jgi:hypothetical protein
MLLRECGAQTIPQNRPLWPSKGKPWGAAASVRAFLVYLKTGYVKESKAAASAFIPKFQ